MKPRHAAALALVMLGTLTACSPVEHTTDKQAAMAHMNFSPERQCEQITAFAVSCPGERQSDPVVRASPP
jgi:hypothetical protein